MQRLPWSNGNRLCSLGLLQEKTASKRTQVATYQVSVAQIKRISSMLHLQKRSAGNRFSEDSGSQDNGRQWKPKRRIMAKACSSILVCPKYPLTKALILPTKSATPP